MNAANRVKSRKFVAKNNANKDKNISSKNNKSLHRQNCLHIHRALLNFTKVKGTKLSNSRKRVTNNKHLLVFQQFL